MQRFGIFGLSTAAVCLLAFSAARADRVLLSPQGDTLPPSSLKTEFALSPSKSDESLSWVQISTGQGIEFETQRASLVDDLKARYVLNVQYPLLYDLGSYPAVSIGVRDLFGTGQEHKGLYVATTKSFPLSNHQLRYVRSFKLNAGLGTGRLDGPFVGMQAHFTAGMDVYAEIYRRRPNIGIALPLAHNVQARAYSLDGTIFYGLSYSLIR